MGSGVFTPPSLGAYPSGRTPWPVRGQSPLSSDASRSAQNPGIAAALPAAATRASHFGEPSLIFPRPYCSQKLRRVALFLVDPVVDVDGAGAVVPGAVEDVPGAGAVVDDDEDDEDDEDVDDDAPGAGGTESDVADEPCEEVGAPVVPGATGAVVDPGPGTPVGATPCGPVDDVGCGAGRERGAGLGSAPG
jgi:hypothetical protein